MGKFFNLDSPFVQFMNRVADLMWLNILYLICCIPFITIGASTTAMYYVTLKMVRNEESYITKSFFKSFKQNFLQATGIWMIFVIAGGVLLLDYRIISGQTGVGIGSGTAGMVMQVLLIAVLFFYLFTLVFVFPLLSKFDNSVKNTMKNALFMSIRHFPVTLGSISLYIIILFLMYKIPVMTAVAFLLVFSTAAYICSLMFVRVFDEYIPAQDEVAGSNTDETDSTADDASVTGRKDTASGETEC